MQKCGSGYDILRVKLSLRFYFTRRIIVNPGDHFFLQRLYMSEINIYIQFYTLEGRRDTTGDFAKISIHLVLNSAALVELAKSIPVHFLILSCNLFFCLSFLLFPFTVPYSFVFAKPEDLDG